MLLLMLMAWLPKMLIAAAVFFLGFRAVRAFERRSAASDELSALRDRVQALEDAMTDQSHELQRVAAGQEFAEQLLARREPHPSTADS